MKKEEIIQKWMDEHAAVLADYSKGNANNEIMKMHRSQLANILEFIEDIRQMDEEQATAAGSYEIRKDSKNGEWCIFTKKFNVAIARFVKGAGSADINKIKKLVEK